MSTRTVTGTWRSFDGAGPRSPRTGTVTFEPSTLVRDSISNHIVVQDPVVAELDANGQISVQLQVTDDANLNPVGWFWVVTERITGLTARRYQMLLPGGLTAFDLSDIEVPYSAVPIDPDEIYIRGFEALHTVLDPDELPSLSYEVVNSVGKVTFNLPRAADIDIGSVQAGTGPADALVTDTGVDGDSVLNFTLPRPTVDVGTVTPGVDETDAQVVATDVDGAVTLDFTVPRGIAATADIGTTTVVNPDQNPNVTNSGTNADAVFDFDLPRAADVSVGTVTTLPPGSSAAVTDVGVNGDVVLDFDLPKGQDGTGTAYYGQMYSQTSQLVGIVSAGAYVPVSITGTFDTANSFGTVAPTTATFGVKNDSGAAQLFTIVATADVQIGNNKTAGFRLAINGVDQPNTTCSATTGTSNFAKLMTQWFVELQQGDEVSLAIANLTDSNDITVDRSKIIAFTAGRQGEPGPAGAGLAVGGTAGQVLVKVDSVDYNTQWADPVSAISALTDVDLTGLGDGSVLIYDSVAGVWVVGEPAAGAKGGGNDKVFWENDQTVDTDYTITTGQNAGTFGPVSIQAGVTVTVPAGSEWSIV